MLDCLVNYVGLRGCNETAPGSGLWVNNLPGIQRELLDKIATADQSTYKQAWLDIQNNAVQELEIDLVTGFSNRYKTKSLMRSVSLLKNIDTTSTTAAGPDYRGFLVDWSEDMQDGYVPSNMLAVSVDQLELYLPSTCGCTINVKIMDGNTGEVLFTTNISDTDQVTGWNVIPVNQLFFSTKLLFLYDATEVDSVELTLPRNINEALCQCLHDGCLGEVHGIIVPDTDDLDTNTQGTNSYGLTATLNFTCSYQKLICGAKMQFAKPLQFLLGSKVMEAALYTNRFGRFNTVDRKITEQLKDDYYQDYLTALQLVLKGMELDESDPCICCDPPLKTVFVRP